MDELFAHRTMEHCQTNPLPSLSDLFGRDTDTTDDQ